MATAGAINITGLAVPNFNAKHRSHHNELNKLNFNLLNNWKIHQLPHAATKNIVKSVFRTNLAITAWVPVAQQLLLPSNGKVVLKIEILEFRRSKFWAVFVENFKTFLQVNYLKVIHHSRVQVSITIGPSRVGLFEEEARKQCYCACINNRSTIIQFKDKVFLRLKRVRYV